MTRYRIVFLLLLVGIYFAYKQMKVVYQNIPTTPISTTVNSKSDVQSPRLKNHSIENFYYIIVDRFSDGDKSNNKNVDLYNNLSFHGGDFAGITNNLDHFNQLGVTSIVLSSPQLQRSEPYKFNYRGENLAKYPFDGSYPIDLETFDPHFGTYSDLLTLTEKAHDLGIKVYLTYNFFQLDKTTPKLSDTDFKKYLSLYAPECKPGAKDDWLNCVYSQKVRFNHENKDFQNYSIEVLKKLKKLTNIDGVFLDGSRHFPQSFVSALEGALDIDPNISSFKLIYSIGITNHEFQRDRFSQDRSDYLLYNDLTPKIENWVLYNLESAEWINNLIYIDQYSLRKNFLLNLSASTRSLKVLYNSKLDKVKSHLAIWAFSSSNLLMNYGEEFGIANDNFPDQFLDMPWPDKSQAINNLSKADNRFMRLFSKILNYRKNNKDFLNTKIQIAYQTEEVIIMEKVVDGKAIAYLSVNLTDEEQNIFLKYKNPPKSSIGTDLISDEKLSTAGNEIIFTLAPYTAQFVVF